MSVTEFILQKLRDGELDVDCDVVRMILKSELIQTENVQAHGHESGIVSMITGMVCKFIQSITAK